jgi:membrane protein insertase Oxa1/YidC/SpoIIIJ
MDFEKFKDKLEKPLDEAEKSYKNWSRDDRHSFIDTIRKHKADLRKDRDQKVLFMLGIVIGVFGNILATAIFYAFDIVPLLHQYNYVLTAFFFMLSIVIIVVSYKMTQKSIHTDEKIEEILAKREKKLLEEDSELDKE